MIDRNDIANYAKRFTFVSNDGTVHSLLEIIYPVGIYYWSSDSTSPKELFGFGEWFQIKDRFILAIGDKFKTVNETGGSFKIEADKIPSHIHNIEINSDEVDLKGTFITEIQSPGETTGIISYTVLGGEGKHGDDAGHYHRRIKLNIDATHTHTFNVDLKDDNNNFPNNDYVQPYITAYCWKRIE